MQAFLMRYLFRFEAEHLLARCGFEVEHLHASYDRGEHGTIYPGELIFVARHSSTERAPGIQEPKEKSCHMFDATPSPAPRELVAIMRCGGQ